VYLHFKSLCLLVLYELNYKTVILLRGNNISASWGKCSNSLKAEGQKRQLKRTDNFTG
jgi:hypothetical protein